jgi:uncharacterized protein (DUF885 family)
MGLSTASSNCSNPRAKEVPTLNATALGGLGALDRAQLIGQDRLSYDVLDRDLRLNLEGDRSSDWHARGRPAERPCGLLCPARLGKEPASVSNAKDYDDFLKRMDGLVVVLDQVISNMCERMKANVVQPKAVRKRGSPARRARHRAAGEERLSGRHRGEAGDRLGCRQSAAELTAEQFHQLGLQEVARLRAEGKKVSPRL